MTPLRLRRVTLAAARAWARLGNGCDYTFTLNGEKGVLRLAPIGAGRRLAISGGSQALTPCVMAGWPGEAADIDDGGNAPASSAALSQPGTSGYCCEHGLLLLSAPGPVLGLLAACPALPQQENDNDPAAAPGWYWSLYNQLLAEDLQALFGSLRGVAPQSLRDPVTLEIRVTLGDRRARSLLRLATATLSRLLENTGWRRAPPPLPPPEDLPLALPLTLGTLSLALDELCSLQPDDVLLPGTAWFSPAGEGGVRCGHLAWRGQLQSGPGVTTHFYITTMENTDVTTHSDKLNATPPQEPDAQEAWETGPLTDASAFAPLPLLLSVRCGQLHMTLGALQRLGPGALLVVDNVLPGEAVLCHGEYALAKGELVDVEGRLGLQITQVFSACRDPLRGGV